MDRAKIDAFKQHVRELSSQKTFTHHKWFVKWHLEIVEKIAFELLKHYPEANHDLVELMVWLHDYGKIIDFDNQYETTITAGKTKLLELGFQEQIAQKAIDNIKTIDSKSDIESANIEVQIVSSADGCSHMVGPFMYTIWHEGTDTTYPNKSLEELMQMNIVKTNKDWEKKITLPEARTAFAKRHEHILETSGVLPEKFLTS